MAKLADLAKVPDGRSTVLQGPCQTYSSLLMQVAGVELVQTDLVAGLLPRLAGAVDLLVRFCRFCLISSRYGAAFMFLSHLF